MKSKTLMDTRPAALTTKLNQIQGDFKGLRDI